MLLRSLTKLNLYNKLNKINKLTERSFYINSIKLRRNLDDDSLSDSEKWLRYASDTEDPLGGNISAFEDEEGNLIRPTGELSNSIALRKLKKKSEYDRYKRFVDKTTVKLKAGNGGNGMISATSLFAKELAGPDGGDGGNGGHIIFRANRNIKSLAGVKQFYKGEDGEKGMSSSMFGKSGEHLFIDVPVGTLIKLPPSLIKEVDNDNNKTKKENEKKLNIKDVTVTTATRTIADLDEDGSMFLAAKGGTGGHGNQFFLSNENRHPRIAEAGAQGEEFIYLLEMKTIAHVGLVGFPNVGKSTLLSAVTRAKPKIENMEFTTKTPNVGIIDFNDYTQIAIADLPGLIEDAHLNRGLGIQFLRHLERCVCLMYVIDLSKEDPIYQFETLKKELELYKRGLSKRPHAIVGSKIDLPNSESNLLILKNYLKEHTPENEVPIPIISCSGKYGKNLVEFVNHIRGLYDLYNKKEFDEPGFEW